MDGVREFLEDLQKHHRAMGHFLGLLHILIGRRLSRADGALISAGLTWRDVATLLRTIRWEPDAVKELGIDPESLPPRDRQRYWYSAISQAHVSSEAATIAGDAFAVQLARAGYVVGSAPGAR